MGPSKVIMVFKSPTITASSQLIVLSTEELLSWLPLYKQRRSDFPLCINRSRANSGNGTEKEFPIYYLFKLRSFEKLWKVLCPKVIPHNHRGPFKSRYQLGIQEGIP